MASHMEIRPADDSLALTLAEAAYSKAGMHATYLTGTISVDNGDGLLIAGDARIPIRGQFPQGNVLYELFSTNPNERAQA